MAQPPTLEQRIHQISLRDGRYDPEAYHFVFQGLDYTVERLERRQRREAGPGGAEDRHVSAASLMDGLRDYALEQFGPLARLVLERWGLYRTEDFGEIVFGLVEDHLLNKQESDRKMDFRNGFNFCEAFDTAWRGSPRSVE